MSSARLPCSDVGGGNLAKLAAFEDNFSSEYFFGKDASFHQEAHPFTRCTDAKPNPSDILSFSPSLQISCQHEEQASTVESWTSPQSPNALRYFLPKVFLPMGNATSSGLITKAVEHVNTVYQYPVNYAEYRHHPAALLHSTSFNLTEPRLHLCLINGFKAYNRSLNARSESQRALYLQEARPPKFERICLS